jgi:hypothetical protein
MRADKRLTAWGDVAYAAKECSGDDVQDRLVELVARDPRAMPCYRAQARFHEGLIKVALQRSSASNNEQKALQGSFHDMIHLSVGAAYCDVFTCDHLVADWLGDLRKVLGLRPQLSRKQFETADKFVGALVETWPPKDAGAHD